MGEIPTSRQIDDQAAAWVARRDRGDLSDADRTDFDAWLTADRRAAGAMLRAEAVMLDTASAKALGRDFDPLSFQEAPVRTSRRRLLAWGGAAAACVAGGGVIVSMSAGEAQATAIGEVRLVPLSDGSSVTLNTDSRAVFRIDRGRREIELTRGEAFFAVARDPERPFTVKIGDGSLRCEGGAFSVRRMETGRSEIVVQSGSLRLDRRGSNQPIGANVRVVVDEGGVTRVATLAGRDIDRALAWREGKLAFEGETLAEAAALFARYGGPRILIKDAALAREPITGLFAANDPAGFCRAAGLALGAQVERRREGLVMFR